MVFPWSLNDRKSSQVFRTLLSILANLNAVVWMVSARPLISKSSSPFSKLLGIIPSISITNGITITFMFNSFLSSLARFKYLSLFSFSLVFTLWSTETEKSTRQQVTFFLLTPTSSSGRDLAIPLYLKIPENFVVSLSLIDSGSIQFPVDNLPHPVISYPVPFFELICCCQGG